ncbi:AIM24 family protein [Sanguibacter massiliensis]|uniref:AIM24 family protein n=1 Tax=Sanguibacter massiliensis TaxID=1973217 RepID=UPI000C826543|nr:AIM24 family protein [Sanguibacter massiliensis]
MTLYGALFQQFAENTSQDQFSLQGSKMLKINMGFGPVWSRSGAMVAYQGDVRFEKKGQGAARFLKAAVTGEGLDLMKCSGSGQLFLADLAQNVQIIYLENDMISINGASVLAISDSIQWDIKMIKPGAGMAAGGLSNVVCQGTGYIAVTTAGEPVALDVTEAPTFGDPQAVVLWTGGVQMNVKVDTGGLGSLLRGGSGETFQLAFGGQGVVVVQPSEGFHFSS